MKKRTDVSVETLNELFIYNPDTGILTRRVGTGGELAGVAVGSSHRGGYLEVGIRGGIYKVHRVAWAMHYGEWPKHNIDHINGKKADNRIVNLRDVPQAINIQNAYCVQSNSKTGFRGVHHNQWGTFAAKIQVDGVQYYLGAFKTPELASKAYIAAKKRLHVGCSHMA